jgi:hypothetical protein
MKTRNFVLFEPNQIDIDIQPELFRLALLLRDDLQKKLDSGFPEEILSVLIDSQPGYMNRDDYACIRKCYNFFVVRIDDKTAAHFEKLYDMAYGLSIDHIGLCD